MGTQLAVMTRKLSKIQASGSGQIDDGAEEVVARLQAQNRELARQNQKLSEKASKPPRTAKGRASPTSTRKKTGGQMGSASRPKSAGAPAGRTATWTPDRDPVGGGFESKLRSILQERDMQIRTLKEERDRLSTQLERGGGAAAELKELQHTLKTAQGRLDLEQSKFEQQTASFAALKSNHERALEQVDELNKELQDERRKSSQLGHEKKVFQVTKDRVTEMEMEVERLRQEKSDVEEQNTKLTDQALSGQASMAYKEQIRDLKSRVKELTEINQRMEGAVNRSAEEVAELKDKVQAQGKTYGSFQDDKLKMETDLHHLQRVNKELTEKVQVFTGDTGIDIEDLEKALAIVKKGDVAGLATSGPAKGIDSSGETITTLKNEKMHLVQDLEKLQRVLDLQDKINTDYKAELDAQKLKFAQMRREYDYKLQEANRTLATRAERVRILETRLRNQVYSLSRNSQRDGNLKDSMMQGSGLGGGAVDDDNESVMSDGLLDDDIGDGQNVFELTIRELTLDASVMADSSTPPATFFTYDFFEHETQTTPVVSGTQQRLEYTSQFMVKVDAFFLNYLATKTMKLELLQSCGGMDFKPMAACQVQFRPLLDTLSTTATPAMSGKPESPFVELTADMVSITGGGGKNQPLVRSVIGSVTYRLRFRHPATQAIQLIQDRLAAHAGRSTMSAAPSSSGSGAHTTDARELCVQVKEVNGLKARTAEAAPAPYVHYRLLDFPDHFTPSMQGDKCSFNDLECYQLQVGDEDSPIARWLSTGTIDFTVFDDRDEKADFFFGSAKVRIADLVEYPSGKVTAEQALEDADGKVNGTVKVEIFWSHALSANDRQAAAAQTKAAAGSAAKPTVSVPASAAGAEPLVAPGSAPETAKDTGGDDGNVEELHPVEVGAPPPGGMISTAINLNAAASGGNDRYGSTEADAEPEPDAAGAEAPPAAASTPAAVDAEAAPAPAADDAAGGPSISIQVHKIVCSEDLVASAAETPFDVYVAVEWLQDAGDDARELETPSRKVAAEVDYTGDPKAQDAVPVPAGTRDGDEIKRKLAAGKVEVSRATLVSRAPACLITRRQTAAPSAIPRPATSFCLFGPSDSGCVALQMEFALVKDPGGEDPQCDDLGVGTIDLVPALLEKDADYVNQTLAVIGPDDKKVADIVVSVTALDALRALKVEA